MVERKKLNKPFGRAKGKAIWWITEIGVEWSCSSCRQIQKSNTIAIQLGVPTTKAFSVPTSKDTATYFKQMKEELYTRREDLIYTKSFICMVCAKKLCQDVVDTIEQIEHAGVKAFQTMDSI